MEIAGQICKQDTVGGGNLLFFSRLAGWLDGASYLTNRWDRDSLIIKSAEKRDSTRFGSFFFSKMFSDNISVCVCVGDDLASLTAIH
jgi:hypothetical protein